MASILRKQNEMINVNPVTADQIPYGSGSVEDALDGLQADIVARDKGIVLKSVNTDGIKTYSQLIDQLYSTISANINDFASLRIYVDSTIFYPSVSYRFFSGLMSSGETSMINRYINVKSSDSVYGQLTATVGSTSVSISTSYSTTVPPSGYAVKLIKV